MHIKTMLGLALLALLGLFLAAVALYRGYLTPVLPASSSPQQTLQGLRVPAGFSIELYADDVPGARSLSLSPAGTLFVGTRNQGKVYALVDLDRDFQADRVYTLASGLEMPNGVAFRDGDLYVAEVGRILRFADIEADLVHPPSPTLVSGNYPGDHHHGWKFIAFGPDGGLYVPVGAPCNICQVDPDRYALISRLDVTTGRHEVFARGVRNTVGFDWHPDTGELWFTDNGRDWLGDDLPPDELNRAPRAGLHFGFPYCHGNNLSDPEFGKLRSCDELTPPALELGPHVAALGMRFYRGRQFPEAYRNGIFIAEHGSWNRSTPIGYRVMFVGLDAAGKPRTTEVFASGWLSDGVATGRPVDLVELPDGSLLVSDDKGGRIYRIVYEG